MGLIAPQNVVWDLFHYSAQNFAWPTAATVRRFRPRSHSSFFFYMDTRHRLSQLLLGGWWLSCYPPGWGANPVATQVIKSKHHRVQSVQSTTPGCCGPRGDLSRKWRGSAKAANSVQPTDPRGDTCKAEIASVPTPRLPAGAVAKYTTAAPANVTAPGACWDMWASRSKTTMCIAPGPRCTAPQLQPSRPLSSQFKSLTAPQPHSSASAQLHERICTATQSLPSHTPPIITHRSGSNLV